MEEGGVFIAPESYHGDFTLSYGRSLSLVFTITAELSLGNSFIRYIVMPYACIYTNGTLVFLFTGYPTYRQLCMHLFHHLHQLRMRLIHSQ